nr:MAG TPA: hypothetical protein [Caudoviricetes sp.]
MVRAPGVSPSTSRPVTARCLRGCPSLIVTRLRRI